MRLSCGINLGQMQKFILTPELRQAITVLQLSTVDLINYIENEMLENPLLEVPEESEINETDNSEPTEEDYRREWCEYLAEYGQIDRSFDQTWIDREDADHYNIERFVAQQPNLQEYLTLQLHFAVSDPVEQKIGEFLIGNINDQGYLQIKLEEASRISGYPVRELERLLSIIQSFDPPGVGARNLSECLLIQIEQRGLKNPVIEKIVRNFLNDLAKGNLVKIASALGLTVQEVQLNADLIKTLDPKPGRNFSCQGDIRYIIPDIVVEKVDGDYLVLVNDVSVPRLSINKFYQILLKQRDACDSATTKFIENKLKSAVWLIRSIEQRRLTLYKVAHCVVELQRDFFEKGVKHLKALTQKQVARAAGLHESTVSRAVANKYMQTPRGVFELKFFFSSGVENVSGEALATESIKRILKELVEREDPYCPYSDQALSELLEVRGIHIARRTVAKYRQEIGIPSARQRRKYR